MGELGGEAGAWLSVELAEDHRGLPVVKLEGELDMTTAPQLEAALQAATSTAPGRLVIDASGLQFADSSAIAVLVRWANQVGRVEIHNPPELLRRVIVRMGLSERLELSP